jgi:rhodanese-related sulfurtransferase
VAHAIQPAALADSLDSSEDRPFLLDIRPAADYERGAIEGSHNVPVYDDLAGGDESTLRAELDAVPTDRETVVICKQGIVATRATDLLREAGYDARTLRGGMSAWRGFKRNSLSYRLRRLYWRLR